MFKFLHPHCWLTVHIPKYKTRIVVSLIRILTGGLDVEGKETIRITGVWRDAADSADAIWCMPVIWF
jgi:hypothetical protein